MWHAPAGEPMSIALRNILFTVVVPGAGAVYGPWWILSRGGALPVPVAWLAILPIGFGVALYITCVWLFARVGRGDRVAAGRRVRRHLGAVRRLHRPRGPALRDERLEGVMREERLVATGGFIKEHRETYCPLWELGASAASA